MQKFQIYTVATASEQYSDTCLAINPTLIRIYIVQQTDSYCLFLLTQVLPCDRVYIWPSKKTGI